MIVGVAQLVVNVPDLVVASRAYTATGWAPTFSTGEIANHPNKLGFQARPRTSLQMVHLDRPGETAIEITSYDGGLTAGATAYELAGGGVRVRCSEPDRSEKFWTALGFVGQGSGRMQARALLPAWRLPIELQTGDSRLHETSVDAEGCVLVTMLTTALEFDLDRVTSTGLVLRSTPSWQETISGRPTTIAIIEGPSGELVEMLQAPDKSRNESSTPLVD